MAARGQQRSLSSQAYDALKRQIVELERPPGQRLVERDLAAELNLSRIPLREALRALEAEGLVVIVPRQGAMVSPFTVADVRNLFDVRESVETLATRLAAQRATGEQLQQAQRHLAAARAAVASGEPHAVEGANADFHELIIEMADNPILESMMQPVNARVRWLFNLTNSDVALTQMCGEHEAMYLAIASGDTELASKLALEHVRANREESLERAATWSVTDIDPMQVTKSRHREARP